MRELSLFSGAGGGLLGTKLLGWRSVGYVERDPYCQAVLAARIRDGFLDSAPIFGDVRRFLSGGWAERYRGLVDVVTAGFPCQPFSVAGKRAGAGDDRNLWPDTARVLSVARPRFALLENVPGLASHRYFGTVLGDLAALGFSAEWGVFHACASGAPHPRGRLFILAYARNPGLAIPKREALRRTWRREEGRAASERGALSWWLRDPDNEGPESKSFVGRVAHGVANRVDRLKALGNGQVPAVVVRAWSGLYARIERD